MGPSVKFVSAIKDAFFNKKNGGQFFSREKDHMGGGVRGGFGKRPYFSQDFFLEPFPNSDNLDLDIKSFTLKFNSNDNRGFHLCNKSPSIYVIMIIWI